MSTELKSADEWLATPEYAGVAVLDPDGWDRSPDKFEASWNEKITQEEFDKRVSYSTCKMSRDFINRIIQSHSNV